MGLILTIFFLTGAFAVLMIAVPLALLFVGSEFVFNFVSEHWIVMLLIAFAVSLVVNLVPVRRGENNTFVSFTGEIYTAKNYIEFLGGLAFASFFVLVLAQLF